MTDMVRSMATAPRADPADQSESDTDGSVATVGATSTSSDRMCAALETDILKDLGKPMRFDGSDDMWCEWVFTTRAWVLMSGLSTPELLQEVEERAEKIELIHMNDSLVENSKKLYYALIVLLQGPVLTLVRHVEPTNGYECWRVLHRRYERCDEQTMMGVLQTIMIAARTSRRSLTRLASLNYWLIGMKLVLAKKCLKSCEWLFLEKDYQNR